MTERYFLIRMLGEGDLQIICAREQEGRETRQRQGKGERLISSSNEANLPASHVMYPEEQGGVSAR